MKIQRPGTGPVTVKCAVDDFDIPILVVDLALHVTESQRIIQLVLDPRREAHLEGLVRKEALDTLGQWRNKEGRNQACADLLRIL